jgi:hypothetical protein
MEHVLILSPALYQGSTMSACDCHVCPKLMETLKGERIHGTEQGSVCSTGRNSETSVYMLKGASIGVK